MDAIASLDRGALFTAVRRELEPVWAADTRRKLLALGLCLRVFPFRTTDKKKSPHGAGLPDSCEPSNRILLEDTEAMSTTTEENARPARSSGALLPTRAQQQIATRQVLAEVTGLKLVTIDDHLNRMVEGMAKPPARWPAVVEIIDKMPPPRAVSVTDTPEKVCIIEVGDEMFRLWPEELRILAVRLSGLGRAAQQHPIRARDRRGHGGNAFGGAKAGA